MNAKRNLVTKVFIFDILLSLYDEVDFKIEFYAFVHRVAANYSGMGLTNAYPTR